MVTNGQYPHILQLKVEGNWTDITICKDQPNTQGAKTTISDRTDYLFSSLVYIPKQDIIIKPGQNLRIITGKDREVRIEAPAVRFSKDNFHYRIWI
jgi:hypothetical protein